MSNGKDKKWNLQDIKPASPRRRRSTPPPPAAKRPVEPTEDDVVHIGIENGRQKNRSHLIIALVVFFLIVGGGVVASYLMAGADVTVYPKHRTPTINATFEAFKTPQVDELSYEILTLEADGERQVTATGQTEVTEQATGILTVFKDTPGAERLIKNTRFESPDGLIFRISESVVVPGAVTDAEGELQPGQIQAEVFAENAGEEYNLEAGTRFTIPGFAEGGFTDLFENMYAENEASFTGGFDGMRFTIDEAELDTATQALHTELRDALLSRVSEERPADMVLFEDAITFTYESQPAIEYGDDLATIREKAILRVPLFRENDFANYLATASIPGHEDEPVRIEDLGVLSFSYTSATTSASNISNSDLLSFELVGKPRLIWAYDQEQLRADLLGAPKTAINTVIGGYPAVQKVTASIRPFWRQSFPTDLNEITVTEVIEEVDSE